jgi:hypothetical protein
MGEVIFDTSMSLDGFMAAANPLSPAVTTKENHHVQPASA